MTTTTEDPTPSATTDEPILTEPELARLAAFRSRWGALRWTREQGTDPQHGYQRRLAAQCWVQVPLVELDGQRCYTWLQWLAWRRDHRGLVP